MKFRNVIINLLVSAVLLTLTAIVVAALATLLRWLGDHQAAQVVGWIAVACTVLWVLNLTVLLLALAAKEFFQEIEPSERCEKHRPPDRDRESPSE